MKRYILIGLFIFIICFAFIDRTPESSQVRIRVIGESNSDVDQEIKMTVVNELNVFLRSLDNKNNINEMIKKNLDGIEEVVFNSLLKFNKENDFKVAFKKCKFPPKSVNNKCIKGGTYKTLLIVIGEGEGRNWWSLLYPEFFKVSFEDYESGNVEIKSYFYEKIKDIF